MIQIALRKKGEIYIGVIIAMALFLILSQAVITLVMSAYDLVSYTRARTSAKQLASEKMELVRNLPYDKVGTINGIPSGVIAQVENVTINGLSYEIRTRVEYVDDSFDGTAPGDVVPNDYKRARIDVSWGGLTSSTTSTITLISDVAPKGVEEAGNGGTLSILVFDSLGQPVPQADIRVVATSVNPNVDYSTKTNDNGRVILPGSPACSNACYQIFASKEGFSSEKTYATSEIANPNKPNVSVITSRITEVSFAIDHLSTFEIHTVGTKNSAYAPLGGQTIHLKGNKTLGTDATDAPIYKYEADILTDGTGLKTVNNLEWDVYQVTLPATSSYDIAGTNPLIPYNLNANENKQLLVSLASKTNYRVLTSFVDPAQSPIASVSARLTDLATYDATAESGISINADYGQIFWSGLQKKTYLIEASVSGYATYSANINVTGYNRENIILTPQ